MIKMALLSEVIEDQLNKFKNRDIGIPRNVEFDKYIKTQQITIISGIRRSGKSTLLAQFSKKFENFYYFNFDDDRIADFALEDFQELMIAFQKLYASKIIFLDEIQNVEGWERFIRRIYDEGYKIFITGSNAKLLSSELATHLTGRYVKIELYPFSFKEFLRFKKVEYGKKTSAAKAEILKYFDEYLKFGGFPDFLKYGDEEFLKRIYNDILYKDLLVRFKIKEVKAFKQLAAFLFTNFTKEVSYNSLKNILGFKSSTSVRNYIDFMQESFLVFELYKYDFSLKKQFISDKKLYVIDNGLRNVISFYFSEDLGKSLENLVFLELKRRGNEIYYYKNKKECDFLIKDKARIIQAIQVSKDIEPGKNKDRELGGLMEAMAEFNLKEGTILTQFQEDSFQENGYTVNIVPIWKWLLDRDA
ncbi:ATP-binding protein [Patescibacteria group bacterium]|nr:ATP-binding protein [Patescibacteria group bacterium]